MQDVQFLKFVPVVGEKHVGFAYVRWLGKIILLYKVMPSQDGSGYWIATGSAKIGLKHDGKDNYQEWFQLDSSFDRDEMKEFILSHVKPALANRQASVFQPQQNQPYGQQNPNYGHNQQQGYAQPNPNYQQQSQQQGYAPMGSAPSQDDLPF